MLATINFFFLGRKLDDILQFSYVLILNKIQENFESSRLLAHRFETNTVLWGSVEWPEKTWRSLSNIVLFCADLFLHKRSSFQIFKNRMVSLLILENECALYISGGTALYN